MKNYAKFFVFWALSVVVYVVFFFVFRPDVDYHGSSLIKFNECKLYYEACVEGVQRRVGYVEDVPNIPLHDGMQVYYLKLANNASIVYRAEDCTVEKWATLTHFYRWNGDFWFWMLIISLAFVFLRIFTVDQFEYKPEKKTDEGVTAEK